jgi:predicted permease
MYDVFGLVLPFFGLIFLGFVVARITRQPLEALGWMNTFIIYVALPALFFQLLSKTPIEKLTEWSYILGAVASTYVIFTLMFVGSLVANRSRASPRPTETSAIWAPASHCSPSARKPPYRWP